VEFTEGIAQGTQLGKPWETDPKTYSNRMKKTSFDPIQHMHSIIKPNHVSNRHRLAKRGETHKMFQSVACRRVHSLMNEILPLFTDRTSESAHGEMAYLLQILYLKGCSFTSLVTFEMKTTQVSVDMAIEEVMNLLHLQQLPTAFR
jgi:hypothetical protein